MAVKKRELISRAEYARRKGVAPRTVGKYTQKGIIPTHGNKIDPAEADKILAKVLVQPLGSGRQKRNTGKNPNILVNHPPVDMENLPDREPAPETGMTGNTFVDARTREKQIKVQLLELDLKLKLGQMVLVKDVEFTAFTTARHVRDKMLNIPDRICAEVAAEMDETTVRNIITAQIESELRSIGGDNFDPDQFKYNSGKSQTYPS